jgi:hypothetical protein
MKNMARFHFDFDKYEKLLKAVAAMSRLYSDNEKPFLHSRFIEKLFAHTANAYDFSRKDMSFDAVINDSIGVGIKTFTVPNFEANKSEKIAEMTKHATSGLFKNKNIESLAKTSAKLRNARVRSDANEYGIDIEKSFYHCLVRTNSKAMVHEEPYEYIDLDAIKPLDKNGNETNHFIEGQSGHAYFSDGKHKYLFNVSKNTLFKRFDLGLYTNSRPIDIEIYDDIFTKVVDWYDSDIKELINESTQLEEFVILPLYSTIRKKDYSDPDLVRKKSGLNQWNAGGRKRKFGESYIPVPQKIHEKSPNFFPPRDTKFDLVLPNKQKITAKLCQDNSKALMGDPNTDLLQWLFGLIDGSPEESEKRLIDKKPYTFDDLRLINKDSVKVVKKSNSLYELSMMPLDSYEMFITNSMEDEDDN